MRKGKIELMSLAGCITIGVVYLMVLAKLVIFKYGVGSTMQSISLVPFSFITDFKSGNMDLSIVLKNVLGNIGIFIPFGMVLPAIVPKLDYKFTLLTGFLMSLTIEILQFLLSMGIADVDDVILNTAGVAVGAGFYFGISRRLDRMWNNKFGTFGLLCVLGLLSAGLLYFFGYGSELAPAPVHRVNEEVLNGLDVESADANIQITNIDAISSNELYGMTREYDSSKRENVDKAMEYTLTDSTVYYSESIASDYSPNGNVRSTTVTYSKISREQFQTLEQDEKSGWTAVWSSNGINCDTAIVTIYDD